MKSQPIPMDVNAPDFMQRFRDAVYQMWFKIGNDEDALTTALDTVTFTAPASADYAITVTSTSPWGFGTEDEAKTLLSVVANLQARVNGLESRLQDIGTVG